VRDNLAMLLAEASEVGRGLPRYVERDFARYVYRRPLLAAVHGVLGAEGDAPSQG